MISEISSGVVPNNAAALWTAAGLAKWGLLSAPSNNKRNGEKILVKLTGAWSCHIESKQIRFLSQDPKFI